MPLVPVTHKPTPAHAKQFDGTLDVFLEIINARPKGGLRVSIGFDGSGNFTSLQLSGPSVGASITLGVGDWVVFPDDADEPAFSLDNERALALWQA